MSLQNRVDPFGEIHAVPARGLFTGNRGIIHDPATRTLLKRRWTTKAWIVCTCSYKGRRRDAMGYNGRNGRAGWTELFFLDEVTALAAGHRPCFACRRDAAKEYATAFVQAFAIDKPTVPIMDARLHAERLASGGTTSPQMPGTLPDGAIVHDGRDCYAVRQGKALRWSFDGYAPAIGLPDIAGRARVLTPATTLAVLAQGYRPVWHPSADA